MTNAYKNKNLISFVILYHDIAFEENMNNICEKIKNNFTDINYEILLVKNKEYTFPYKLLKNDKIRHIEIMSDHLYEVRVLGFRQAKGEYVHCIDVDNDYCFRTLVSNIDIIKNLKYDILSFCASSFADDTQTELKIDLWKKQELISEISFNTMLKKTLCWSNKLVKKSLENQMSLEFHLTYDEDVVAFMQMHRTNLKMLHINEPLTIILNAENSISRTFNGIQMESIDVNRYLKTITTPAEFQLLLFRYVCSKLMDIKLMDNKADRNKNYRILKEYIKQNYDKKIIKTLFSRPVIIINRPWFISIVAFLVPRLLLKKLVLRLVHT